MAARKHWLVDLSTYLLCCDDFLISLPNLWFLILQSSFDILVHRSSVFLIHGSSLPNPDLHVATYSPIYYCSLPGKYFLEFHVSTFPSLSSRKGRGRPDRQFLHRGPWYASLVPPKHVRPDVRRPALCRFTTPFSRKYSSSSCTFWSTTAQPSPQS